MGGNNGIALLGPDGQPTNTQLVAAQLASPQNDAQVLCLMAAQMDDGAIEPAVLAERCFALMAAIVEGQKNGKLHEAFIVARKVYGDPRDLEPGPIVPAGRLVS